MKNSIKKKAEAITIDKDKAEVLVEKILMDLFHTEEYRDTWRKRWNKTFPTDGV